MVDADRHSPLQPGDRAPEFTLPADREDAARPFIQFLGQFLVDRERMIRWTNIECAREGLAGLGQFPTEEELLAAVHALRR